MSDVFAVLGKLRVRPSELASYWTYSSDTGVSTPVTVLLFRSGQRVEVAGDWLAVIDMMTGVKP